MRRLPIPVAAMLAGLAALPFGTPPAGATQDFQSPTNLRVREIKLIGAGIFAVHLLWDGPPKVECPGLGVYAAVEVRDVDQNGTFHFVQTHGEAPALFAPGYDLGGFFSDGGSPAQPLREGGVYEIRLSYRWQINKNPPTVPEAVDVTTYAPLLQVTIGAGTGPEPGAPTGVLAIADPKKPRVNVLWKSDAPKGTKFVVQRRTVSGPAKGPKAELDFETISGKLEALRFLDRSVIPDTVYEYRLAIDVDRTLSHFSAPDQAVTQEDKCPPSKFRAWTGAWTLGDDEVSKSMHAAFGGDDVFACVIASPRCDPLSCPGSEAIASGDGPARIHGLQRLKLTLDVKEGEVLPLGDRQLEGGQSADLVAEMSKSDPFTTRWMEAEVTFSSVVGKERRSITQTAHMRTETLVETTVCGSIGHGLKGLPLVQSGDTVAIGFQVGSLGPAPLYAGQLRLECTLEGGTFQSVQGEELIRSVPGEPAIQGRTTALFDVGSLGPVKPGKTETARFVLQSRADGTKPKMRCRIRFVDIPGGQLVKFAQAERVLDVGVGPPSAK